MATHNGITLTPNTGSGTSQLSVSAAEYTGRESRSATFSASNASLDIDSNNSIKITQSGHVIFSVNSPTINSDVTSVTVQGQSNLESIRITGSGTLWNYLGTATINGVTVTKSQLTQGYTVTGDPGASAVYDISFSFTGLPESVNNQTFVGNINNSASYEVSVTKRGTGTIIVDVSSIDVIPESLDIGIGNSYKYNNQTITVNSNSRNQLSYSVTPSNATIVSERWQSGNSSIATVSNSGLVRGVSAGSTYIRCYVSSDGTNEVSDRCYPLNVFANGSISVTNMTIETLAQSGTSTMTLNGIDTSKPLSVAFTNSMPSWISSISINTTTSPYRVVVNCYPNSSHAQDHTTTAYVTGTDNLGNTIESQAFTIYQKWETPCTAMTINGSDTIHNSNNYGDYTVSYTPVGTTENRCVWSISDTSIATVQEGQSNDECRVTAISSGTVTLYATNYYDNSIIAQKQIDVTFVHPRGDITLSPTSVTLPYNATTDSTVAITTTGISGNLTITPDAGGFITGGEIVNNHLKIYFTANDGTTTERSCSVTVSGRDDNDDLISNTVQYLQEGLPVSSNNIGIGDITPVYDTHQETLKDVVLRVNFINNGTISTTFTSVAYTMTGYTDAQGTTVNFTKSGSLANRVDVTAGTTPVDYTIESVGALGIPARIDVTVTATNNSANLTASDTLHIN